MRPVCIFCGDSLYTFIQHYYPSSILMHCDLCKNPLSDLVSNLNSYDSSKYIVSFSFTVEPSCKLSETIMIGEYSLCQSYRSNKTYIGIIKHSTFVPNYYHYQNILAMPLIENIDLATVTENQIKTYLLLS